MAPMADIIVTPEQLAHLFRLYDDGLYLQAYQQAMAIGPLDRWRNTDARVLAGRLAGNLGAPRLADWHFLSAWRRDREHAEALWFYVRALLTRHGPLAAWKFVHGKTLPAGASPVVQSHWLSLHGTILGQLRDFDAAENWLKKADQLGPGAWTCLEWAALYLLEDRTEEAESAARRALQLKPWYRPAVQWVAHFLVQKERDDEAIDLLTQAAQRLESGAIYAQLATLQIELKHYDDAARNLDEFERCSPLLSDDLKNWFEARRCDLASFRGDYGKALEHARKVVATFEAKSDASPLARKRKERIRKTAGRFYDTMIARLSNRNATFKRVEIPVGFVRQHHKTCGPATLTSIAKFWSMPAEHVEVADEISYLGTSHHAERKWAQDHGWHTKAFTVTWDAAVTLIDNGIPFTLTTTEVSSGHLQAVIGYDTARGALIIRDPGERHRVEMFYEVMAERCRATGPRALALVPNAHKERLDALKLPDEALYEYVQRFDLALEGNCRADAGSALDALKRQAPGHFLTLYARRALANYDGDQGAGLAANDQLLNLFADDLALALSRVNYLRVVGGREQRINILKELADREETDPACWLSYAEELLQDPRQDDETLYLLRKAIRVTSSQAPLFGRLLDFKARIRMEQHKFEEGMELYRLALCAEEKDEYIAQNFFVAARSRGETDRVLEFLRTRFQRLGAKSSQPARTLFNALLQLERYEEAYGVLDQAIRLRPEDGELLTYAADAHIYRGEFEEAERILAKADGVSRPVMRLRSLAALALSRNERRKARDLYEEILKIEPLAFDAVRLYAMLLGETDERSATLGFLQGMCQRFPHHFPLAQLHYDWLANDGPSAREPILKKLVEDHPHNAWARIEYAYLLSDLDRMDEAHQALDEAEPLEPDGPGVWFARGLLHKKKQRTDDAQFAFRETIRKSVDFVPAQRELIGQCDSLQDRRDAVAFITNELIRQPTNGAGLAGLSAFPEGLEFFSMEELLACKRRVLEARRDLAAAWACAVNESGTLLGREAEWLALAQEAVERFPMHADLWVEFGEAQHHNGNTDAELKAFERAVELSSGRYEAVRMLAAAHERLGSTDAARTVLERAIKRAPRLPAPYLKPNELPLLPALRMELGELLWRHGEHDAAITQARQALAVDPWFNRAWNGFFNWCIAMGRTDELIAQAKSWTQERPGEPAMWFRLATAIQAQRQLPGSAAEAERIDGYRRAYDEAIRRFPAAWDFYDAKADVLAWDEQIEEAKQCCAPAVYKGRTPIQLRARAAWIKGMQRDYDAAKQQMAAVLREEPNYKWAWDFLLDWSFATHEFKEALDVASELCRRWPNSSFALSKRGFCRLQASEREAGIQDLKMGFRKDPFYWPASNQLFDEQIIDDDLVGAEETLRGQMQGGIGRNFSFVKGNQVQFQAKRDNKDLALTVFKDLCEMPQSFQVPAHVLDKAMRGLDQAGWKKEAEQIVLTAMQKPNWNTQLAMMFAGRWNPSLANDLPDRITALDRALGMAPMTFVFLDLKAQLLADAHQFERAWQVCQEKTFAPEQAPLEGRAAWVLYRSNRTAEAFAKMKEIVKDNPKYQWGWWQLADWYGRQQNWVEVLTVAEHLVIIGPRDPSGYAFRGQAKQNLGDPQAARTDYLHALDIDPAYLFASWQLFDLAARNGEWQRAEKILDKAKKYADKAEWALRRVDLLVYQNRKASFPTEFESLCRNCEKTPWLLEHSLTLLVQAGWWGDAEEVLHRCLDLGPHICDPWVRLRVQMGDRKVGDDVQNMSTRRPERTNCIAAYAVELAYAKNSAGLRDWIVTHADTLRADTKCWAKVGGALAVLEDWPGLIEWMSDWSKHATATPGLLLPLVKALRSVDRGDEARKVSLHALTKLNADYASSFHKVWLMFDQALEGDILPVQRYLETSDLGGFDGYHQMIAAMVRALWLSSSDKQNGFNSARRVLGDAAKFAPPTVHDPALTKSYQCCIGELAKRRSTFGAKLWRIWRWLVPTLPKPPKQQ
jgi:tetratricopeptide (TPR) repeat protein